MAFQCSFWKRGARGRAEASELQQAWELPALILVQRLGAIVRRAEGCCPGPHTPALAIKLDTTSYQFFLTKSQCVAQVGLKLAVLLLSLPSSWIMGEYHHLYQSEFLYHVVIKVSLTHPPASLLQRRERRKENLKTTT